ncbi:ATPase AAA [Candidatus Desulfarcum epimagneticum]|uniref:ATPase AAA n=1 Tax=uncultured Desulfobacteraceae bacterium TaxID=218296 RepID=A0A484HGV6_9BACT|nr:ATPase AAA [uncultured Desulfobacteraceae bacterium]
MSKKAKEIPYGISDFETIRNENHYFVDKTKFIPLLEKHKYVFFLRPRRFGKSLWLSILECYYDTNLKDRFDEFFKDTYIGENPTREKNAYLILRFDFAAVNPVAGKVRESFEKYCAVMVRHFMRLYGHVMDEKIFDETEACGSISEKLDVIFAYARERGLKIYILIDEYDNFANTILATVGTDAYHDLTRGEGFFRHFFGKLKAVAAMRGSGLARLFITGVSPVTMDDVTSGFNIGANISMRPVFNEMAGFSEQEVKDMLGYYKKEGLLLSNPDETLGIMREWHNGYTFSDMASSRVFNTDMVLYFIHFAIVNQAPPRYLIDDNVKIDYGKLRHLMFVNRRLNGNFDILKRIMEQGEISSHVQQSFPLDQLTNPDHFISLLYFFGLLTFRGTKEGESALAVPNMTISHLMYGYIRNAYRDTDTFRIDLWEFSGLARKMGWSGEWEGLFSFIAREIKNQTSVRDYLGGEKIIQGFLLAYLSINDFFIPHTEYETGKGYSDFFLEPFSLKYPEMPFGYLIEIKYVKRGELTKPVLKKALDDAKKQLTRYAEDAEFARKYADKTITKLALVYHGWEMVAAHAV